MGMYRTQRALADELGLSKKTMYGRLREMRSMPERYGKYSIIDDGNIVLVFIPAFVDYLANRQRLRNKNMAKYVDDYKPEEVILKIAANNWDLSAEIVDRPAKIDEEELTEKIEEILIRGIRKMKAG